MRSLSIWSLSNHFLTKVFPSIKSNESPATFCGRKNVDKFSYCPLHLIVVFQPRGKKEDLTGEEEIPQFIEKKIKSA